MAKLMIILITCSFLASLPFDAVYGHSEVLPGTKLNHGNKFGSVGSKGIALDRSTTINVDKFGAIGDGKTDDTVAFQKAWKAACSLSKVTLVTMQVPMKKSYLLKPISFLGPCKSPVKVQIKGNIKASDNHNDYKNDLKHWVKFGSVQNLMVEGGGTFNGNGKTWWQKSCKVNKSLPCTDAPTAVTFYKCESLLVKDINIQNSQKMQVSFDHCNNVNVSNVVVTAPEDSPNTDGIHVTSTKNIHISNCVIGTGDDCISIVSGSQNVGATNITCGPGHGISIGSLGGVKSKAFVSGIVVNGASLTRTSNGVRIKTWPGGSGCAQNIMFKNIEMHDVKNPIIIDQNYCDPKDKACITKPTSSAVEVKKVRYENISGSSSKDTAVVFRCSTAHPCQDIVMRNVSLVGKRGAPAKAECQNVNFSNNVAADHVSPLCPADLSITQFVHHPIDILAQLFNSNAIARMFTLVN